MRQPYRFVKECTTTPSPNSTPSMIRYGASLTGPSAPRKERLHERAHSLHLFDRDAREERQRQRLAGERLGDGKRACAVPEVDVRGREVRRARIVPARAD